MGSQSAQPIALQASIELLDRKAAFRAEVGGYVRDGRIRAGETVAEASRVRRMPSCRGCQRYTAQWPLPIPASERLLTLVPVRPEASSPRSGPT
jgi:hypothetical protein